MSTDDRTPPPLTVGSMLRAAWTEVVDENFANLVAAGFDDLRRVHQPFMREILTDNLRPSELAARHGLSKQAINDIVREFEANGYISLEPDPDDGRAKRMVPTERGRLALETAMDSSRGVARRWAEHVGEERFATFEEILSEIADVSRARRPRADPQ